MKCDDLEPLLTAFVDDEASPTDRERVADHLGRCGPCAARAAAEQAARRLVHLRARLLEAPAPPALRSRCAALARTRRTSSSWFSWRSLAVAGAAGLVIAVAGVLTFGVLTESSSLLVAGLTLDHLKCFVVSGAGAPAGEDPRAIEAMLAHDYGWQLTIPGGAAARGLRLVGARRCFSLDGAVAHVLYRHEGQPLSLFVLPRHQRQPAAMAVMGHPARVWSRGGTTFVLVGNESEATLQPVARYFQAAAY